MKKIILLTSLFALSLQASYKDFALYGLQGILNVSEQKKEYGAKAIGCGLLFVGSMLLYKKMDSQHKESNIKQSTISGYIGRREPIPAGNTSYTSYDESRIWVPIISLGLSGTLTAIFTYKFFKTK